MKNTQIRNLNETRAASRVEHRSLYLLWLIWIIWLPFLIPPIVGLIQAHPPLPRLITILVCVALFAGIYLWATWRNVKERFVTSSPPKHREAWVWLTIAVLTMLSIVLARLVHGTGNGNELLEPFIFTSAYIAGSLPTVRAVLAVAALMILTIIGARNLNLSLFQLGQGVIYVSVVGVVTISLVRSFTTSLQLRAAREEITRLAVTTERLRIARDLHDLLGHNLSLIALKSELARRLVSVAPERAIVEISDVENVARTTLQEVREAVTAYRQPTLKSELQAAQEILAAAGIAYRYDGDESMLDALPTTIEAVLSWTIREGVTNVIRHSRAHQCTIRITRNADEIGIEVVDDGAGAPSINSSDSEGNGLRGLAERVETLGGRSEASPRAGGGFRLAVSVPLAQQNHDAIAPGSIAVTHSQLVSVDAPVDTASITERSE